MEDNFRNVLIILSAIIITAIFIHGLWIIRKEKKTYELNASNKKVVSEVRSFDQKGFDQDGVSQTKISKNENELSSNRRENAEIDEPFFIDNVNNEIDFSRSQTLQQSDIFKETAGIHRNALQQEPNSDVLTQLNNPLESDLFKADPREDANESHWYEGNSRSFTKNELGDELTSTPFSIETTEKNSVEPQKAVHSEPLYEQPVTRAKPARSPISKAKKGLSKAELKRDQMEINFDNQANVKQVESQKSKAQLEPQVIIISVVMPKNQQMIGAVLLPCLLTLGLRYGEMNIFHRHEDNAGKGKVTFSLANIMNPGSFDLDRMENFATPGVSLFMTLPNAGDSFSVFEQMLNAAKQLALEFNGQVLDDKRNTMTKQKEQHYFNKIREFERQSRIALVE
ncbi:MAG: cell division protein ZipA [Colwellia sp.]